MCAIGMVNLPFVTNLNFFESIECKNTLKLPRPTLLFRRLRNLSRQGRLPHAWDTAGTLHER